MPIQALNERKKLSSDFNDANDAFIDAVLSALQSGEIPLDLARAYLAHPVAMMHADGAQAVANYFDRILAQRPNIDWTPGTERPRPGSERERVFQGTGYGRQLQQRADAGRGGLREDAGPPRREGACRAERQRRRPEHRPPQGGPLERDALKARSGKP